MTGSFTEQKLTLASQYAVLEACVGWSSAECKERRVELKDYINLYEDNIAQLDLVYGLGGDMWPFSEKKPQILLDIMTKVRELGTTVTRDEARQAIKTHLQLLNISDYAVDSLIDAAVRIWSLVNFRSPADRSVGRGRPCVEWTGSDKLGNTLHGLFPRSTTELTLSHRRLSPHFTCANMVDICGLKVDWASTLDDHLSLDRHRKTLRIFPLRNWLNVQAEHANSYKDTVHLQPTQQKPIPYAPLPRELYEETSRTIDLLFPSWDPKTQRYLKKRGKDFHTAYSNPRLLDLKHYSYWRDKLLELNEDIFLAPPEGWSQLWRDRRDPQKFWTFWIALLVLWLTIVATVAAIIQTWATLAKPG